MGLFLPILLVSSEGVFITTALHQTNFFYKKLDI